MQSQISSGVEDGLNRLREATDEVGMMIAESQRIIAESVRLLELVRAFESPVIGTETRSAEQTRVSETDYSPAPDSSGFDRGRLSWRPLSFSS